MWCRGSNNGKPRQGWIFDLMRQTAQSFHKLKVAFNNAFRMMRNLPTYCSASEMFTVNGVADCRPKAVIRNLVHRFMMRFTECS